MKKNIRILSTILAFSMSLGLLAGCSSSEGDSSGGGNSGPKTYAFLAKDTSNPYMAKVYEGFKTACEKIGVTPQFKGPQKPTTEDQINEINQLINQKVDLIALSANDVDGLQPVLTRAMDAGIKVVSLDSAANKDSRQLHIQQADPEKIGRALIQAAYEMTDGNGGLAILSATAQATNQNLWIEWMKKELEENPDKYKNTPLVKVVYGDDQPNKSTAETTALLQDTSIKVIIAPTTVGMLAAGRELQAKKSEVKLTGLGLPSEMAPFIEDGTCPWMYLWNPVDIGTLAAYAGDALVKGTITGKENDKFTAGEMGEKVVVKAADGGTEVMLGDPFKFDSENIGTWKTVY